MKFNFKVITICTALFVTGCQSNQQIENTFDQNYLSDSSDLVLTSPNFSAMHAPPLMSGFSYVSTFEKNSFCNDKNPEVIGKVTITRNNKTQYSKLPSGDVVALVGYYAIGATGGGLKGTTYYSFHVEPNSKYKITVTEARPLVTSYQVAIEKITDADAVPVEAIKDRRNICPNS